MKVHNVPGKGLYARVGDFFGPIRKTPAQALEALDKELEHHKPLSHTYIRCQDGTVLHLFQMPSHDYTINIIGPEGYVGKGRKGSQTFTESKNIALELADIEFGGVTHV